MTSIVFRKATPDVSGTYGLQLVCNDGKVDGAPSGMTVTAESLGTLSLALSNTGVVGVGRAADVVVTLSAPAPAGGVAVTLSADNASTLGVMTPTVTIPAGQTQVNGTVVGVAAGTTTLRASATGYTQGTLSVDVTTHVLTLTGPLDVPIGGSAALPIAIDAPAPAGGVVVTLTSSDVNVATLASPTVTIPAGQMSADATVNGIALGAATVLAQATGYASDAASVVVGIPATLTVTNLNDSGPGSLREAVVQANASAGANTIVFAPGLTGTITLTSGQLRITDALTIVGPGAQLLTIDGNAADRIFAVAEASPPACPALSAPSDYLVTIAGLTLTNAQRHTDNAGGALVTLHSLALSDVTISNSIAKSGGGLKVNLQYPGQTLTIVDSQFIGNIAKPLSAIATSTVESGGAIAIAENCDGTRTTPVTVAIQNTLLSGNRVQPTELHGHGGAFATFSNADIVIADSRVVDNHVDVPNPPAANPLYRGGGIYGTAKSVHIERTEVSDNSVIDISAGAGTATDATRGGGIGFYNDAADLQTPASVMTVTIVDSTLSGNSVSALGGGAWVYGNVAVTIANSTVAGNSGAAAGTGGIQITTGATNPAGASNALAPTLTLLSSIVGANTSPDLATNTVTIPSFTVAANASLVQALCAGCNILLNGAGNVTATDPKLAPLVLNGGTTRTHALQAGSPAIDAGSNPLALATDQRGDGFPRVVGTAADMGAFELGNFPPVANAGSDQTVSVGQLVQLKGTCTDQDGDPTTPAWSFTSTPSGSAATLSNPAILNPTFTPDLAGNYVVRLVCNDTHTDSLPSSITINTSGALVTLGLVNTQLVGLGQTAQVRVGLSPAAPTGGKTVTLASDNPSVASVAAPGTVTVVQGGTEGFTTVNGVAVGTTMLHATAAGYASAALPVTVTANLVTVGGPTSVTLNSTSQVPIALAQPAPAGGLQIAVSSSDAAIISVDTPTVTIAAGQTSTNATLRGNYPGNVTIVAQAPNYASGTSSASVGVALDITEATISMFQFDNRIVTIALKSGGSPAVAPPGGLSLVLSSTDTGCVVAPSVTVPAGTEATTITLTYGGTTALPCTATITASGPSGVTPDTAAVTVTPAPTLRLYYGYSETNQYYTEAIRIGAGLEQCVGGNLRVEAYNASTGNVTPLTTATPVTITSSNAGVALVSPSDTSTPGAVSTQVTIPANSTNVAFCLAGVEGQAGQTAALTAGASGFDSTARAVNILLPVVGIVGISTSLTTASADEPFNIYVGIGQSTIPDTLWITQQARKGAGGLSVNVSLPDISVAQLKFAAQSGMAVAATIPAGSYYNSATTLYLDPLAAGTTSVSATIPGFLQSGGTNYTNPRSVTIGP